VLLKVHVVTAAGVVETLDTKALTADWGGAALVA
jgi:hypothetical protein